MSRRVEKMRRHLARIRGGCPSGCSLTFPHWHDEAARWAPRSPVPNPSVVELARALHGGAFRLGVAARNAQEGTDG